MRNSCECRKQKIRNTMRLLWSQHVYRTRFFIISTAEELQDLTYVTNKLMENPEDFATALKPFYGPACAEQFKTLLTEHLSIAGALVNASKNMDTQKANELRQEWYDNADEISEFLSRLNPFWCFQKWQDMMYHHLSMTEQEASFRIMQEYPKDIQIFDAVEKEALEMADYMAQGILQQMCCRR